MQPVFLLQGEWQRILNKFHKKHLCTANTDDYKTKVYPSKTVISELSTLSRHPQQILLVLYPHLQPIFLYLL
jgi:hypothetical protein